MTVIGRRISQLLHHEAFGGVLLMLAAAAALGLDNSPLYWLYDAMLGTPVVVQIGSLAIDKPLLLWINDGLMAVFFFLVGLEIKRELLTGRLSSWNQAALPVVAAVGGMAMPALKLFVLALAIIDDLGAIVIIALFYTADLSLASLAIAAACTAVLMVFNLAGVRRVAPYVLVGVVMWVCVLKSGVHATLAGVVIALTIPHRVPEGPEASPLGRLEHALHPWVMLLVMPLFAFANAGVALAGLSPAALLAPIPLGIALGLFAGKQLGVFGFAWAAVRAGICRLPDGVGWAQIYGAGLLAGIGFTMSLFIGALAFPSAEHAAAVRLGVLSSSILSGITGYVVLRFLAAPVASASPARPRPADTPA